MSEHSEVLIELSASHCCFSLLLYLVFNRELHHLFISSTLLPSGDLHINKLKLVASQKIVIT